MTEIIFSSFRQLLFFSLVPLIVYLIRYRKAKGFFDYIGLKPSNRKANLLAMLISLVLGVPLLIMSKFVPEFYEILTDPKSVTGNIKNMGMGPEAITAILFVAIIKTSLAEEILFRGFVAKRLIALTNFQWGNLIQAFIFGIIHSIFFLLISTNAFFLFVIFLVPFAGAWAKTWLNEKLANGSIIPGWIAHGFGNLISYSTVAFLF